MKIIIVTFFILFHLKLTSQIDTIQIDCKNDLNFNHKVKNGYYKIIKERKLIQEYKFVNGAVEGFYKEYYLNGNLKLFCELKTPGFDNFCGLYKEYYESGNIKIEGNYKFFDSIECPNCYDEELDKPIKIAFKIFARYGIWKSYHDNGTLESIGEYKGVHIIHDAYCDYPENKSGGYFCSGGVSVNYLKDKEWKNYSKRGNLIKLEYFNNGLLVHYRIHTE